MIAHIGTSRDGAVGARPSRIGLGVYHTYFTRCGNIRVMLRLYWDNGKKMETTIVYWGYQGRVVEYP